MCTSIIAGKKATKNETILLARNEDFGVNNWNKYLKYRKYPQYEGKSKLEKWILGNGLEVDVPSKSYSYCSIPDAKIQETVGCIEDYYFFEERGINECNVAISSTNSMDMNEKVIVADPPVKIGIEESIILTLILPQVSTAREAVKVLGEYVEKYGASEANGILIGDPTEVWYFEIGSCHHWIAVKVPDQCYLVVANSMRVHLINSNRNDVMHSTGLFDFVKDNKLLENPTYEDFNFAKAFGTPGSIVNGQYNPYYNVDRIWLAQNMLTPSNKQQSRLMEYPMFLEPTEKIEITDIMRVLRADYQNTELMYTATRPIGVVRTAESHIIEIDPTMPDQLKGIIWQAISTPLGSPYMPLFAVTDNIPEYYSIGESDYTSLSAYWCFRSLFSLSDICGEFVFKNLWYNYEKEFTDKHTKLKQYLKDLWNNNREEAIDYAKKYSMDILYNMVKVANAKHNTLLTEIAKKQKDKNF